WQSRVQSCTDSIVVVLSLIVTGFGSAPWGTPLPGSTIHVVVRGRGNGTKCATSRQNRRSSDSQPITASGRF
ncbi:MAG: hypothetical protein OXC72_14095, partial [Roseovarius sp.]|nr:hypothetical protein [Roseovarius sp.]